MNFGESRAYWYFRLNGLFPMPNFVLHEVDEIDVPRKCNADADLLAVRFPHVFEKIRGRPDDWDNERFTKWGLDLDREIIFLICEVKTGEYDSTSVNKSFNNARLLYALRRFGVLEEVQCRSVRYDLKGSGVVRRDGFIFAKVLMSSMSRKQGKTPPMTPCCTMELDDAVTFIQQRMKKYSRQKHAARMFFPKDLIQFFAWSLGVKLADWNIDRNCDLDRDGDAQGIAANSPASGSRRDRIRRSR